MKTKSCVVFSSSRLSLAVALLCFSTQYGYAQQSEDAVAVDEAAIEEIVVTARKREESLMETPVSITAFSGETLSDMNIFSADQIAEQTPGLVFDSTSNISGSANSASIFIRGIGQRDYTLAIEPGVGLYIDDVYLAHSLGNVADVVDIERIEVLRGPQGTLFGRNTIGGAVRVVTKKPGAEYEGMAELVAGAYSRQDIRGNFNVPLNDSLFLRFSGLAQNRDGFVERPFLSGESGNKDSATFVGQLRWLPSDQVTVDFQYSNMQDRSDGAPGLLLKTTGTSSSTPQPQTFAAQVAPEINPTIMDHLFGPEFIGVSDDGTCPCKDYSDTEIPQGLDTSSSAFTLDWELGENLSLKLISAYRKLETDFGRDAGHVPENQNIHLYFYTQYRQQSQELQLSGSGDGVDWIVGLYAYQEEGRSDDLIEFVRMDLLSGGLFETDTSAIFGQATLHLTDRLDLTLGARSTDEKKTAIIDEEHQVVTAFLGSNAFKVPNSASFHVVATGTYVEEVSEAEPYFNLSYRWTEDFMTYISYSEGFKGGGIQVRNGPTPFLPSFGPEFAETTEIGAKWSLANGRVNLSVASFSTDYTDLQITANVTPPGGVATSVVTNAGDAEISGFELELAARPIPDLHLNIGIATLDGKYTKLLDAPGITLDSKLPNAPEIQQNLSVAYDLHTRGGGSITPRVDYSYSDEQFNDASNNESLKREAAGILNLSLGFAAAGREWSGSLFIHNATDEQFILAGFDGGYYADGVISRPREWGLRLRKNL